MLISKIDPSNDLYVMVSRTSGSEKRFNPPYAIYGRT